MSLRSAIKKQFIDILQWTEEDEDTLAWRYPMDGMEIQHGGVLVVRESQMALFVNEGFTTRLPGLPPKESDALLGFLFEHITRPEFQVRWRWQENDIAIWDNRVTQHYANADYLPARRVMHRATSLGDKPVWRPG